MKKFVSLVLLTSLLVSQAEAATHLTLIKQNNIQERFENTLNRKIRVVKLDKPSPVLNGLQLEETWWLSLSKNEKDIEKIGEGNWLEIQRHKVISKKDYVGEDKFRGQVLGALGGGGAGMMLAVPWMRFRSKVRPWVFATVGMSLAVLGGVSLGLLMANSVGAKFAKKKERHITPDGYVFKHKLHKNQ